MMRGEIWWADLGLPFGSEPGYRRPVVIIQDDSFNRSLIHTVIVSAISSNTALAEAPGNVFLEKSLSSLSRNGVINVSQISTLDKKRLLEKVAFLPRHTLAKLESGLKLVLGLY